MISGMFRMKLDNNVYVDVRSIWISALYKWILADCLSACFNMKTCGLQGEGHLISTFY